MHTSVEPAALLVDVQLAVDEGSHLPLQEQFSGWANAAYAELKLKAAEVTIRIVEESEMTELNQRYRGKQGSTNVLSFALMDSFDDFSGDLPEELFDDCPLLGDVVICHSVVVQEAKKQQKAVSDHYAHMVAHGVLHLCGYDHIDDQEAEQMEALEIKILNNQGISNPYN